MKKISKIIISILLLCFSFYYTDVCVEIIKSNNPIMKTIKEEKTKYEKPSVNALINDDTIIPGVSGTVINLDASFNKMFNYGEYNDSLYTFEEVSPSISIDEHYDKYITSGVDTNMNVALVFSVLRDEDILKLLTILSDNNVKATFFIDGLFIENNRSFILNMVEASFEVEPLSYNGNYQEIYFKNALNILNEIRKDKAKYCFSSYKSYKVLRLCKKLELHTVIPSINAKTYPYKKVKNNLKGGSIIYMNNDTVELETTINYIKQRGYNLVRLDELLKE